MRRTSRLRLLVLGSACAALLVPTTAAAAGGKAAKPLILAPRAERAYAAPTVAVRVKAPRGAKRFRARLNGEPVGRYFGPPSARGVRTLQVSSTFGLRYGENRLRVRVGKRTEVARFRVGAGRPLVGAGFDNAVAAGDTVYLDGRAPRGSRLDWTEVSGPGDAKLVESGADAKFTPTVPGSYELRLKAKAPGGRLGSDLVEVRVDPVPAATVDTMAPCPGSQAHECSGIKVGDAFYKAGEPDTAWAQIVVLDRQTLEPVGGSRKDLANKTYEVRPYVDGPVPTCRVALCMEELRRDLERVSKNDLVIVSNPPGGFSPRGIEQPLGEIGVPPDTDFPHGKFGGAFSAIGFVGTQPGHGDWHAVAGAPEGAARMKGYLIRGNQGDFGFQPYYRLALDTQAPGSDANTNVVRIGRDAYKQELSGVGGYQVVVLDRQTLEGESYWFETATGDAGLPARLGAMADRLKRANDSRRSLVIVASRGVPAVGKAVNDAAQRTINSDLQAIADQIDTLGGTRNGIFRAMDPALSDDDSYTLIGWSFAGPGTAAGSEATEGGTQAGNGLGMSTVAMTGALAATGPNSAYELQEEPTIGGKSSGANPAIAAAQLNELLVSPPTAWPEQVFDPTPTGPRHRLAIAWIGQKVFGTDNPRTRYWTVPYFAHTWEEYASKVRALSCSDSSSCSEVPSCSQSNEETKFCAADLEWAKTELQREIGWLINAHTYMKSVAEPFSKEALSSWAAFEAISNSVRDKAEVGQDKQSNARAAAYWKVFRSLLTGAPKVGEVFHAVDTVYELAMELNEINHEPPADQFQARADQLGVKLAERLVAAQEFLTEQVPNLIAADYRKLKAVGSCTSLDPDEWLYCRPFDHLDWEFTQRDQQMAAEVLVPGMEAWAYGPLLAAKYDLWSLPLWWQTDVNKPENFWGDSVVRGYPFDGLPASAQVAKPIYRDIPDYHHELLEGQNGAYSVGDTWQIYALGERTGVGVAGFRWEMKYPKAEVTEQLFKPRSEGGFGLDREAFFDRNFTPRALEHYPEKDTRTGWCGRGPISRCLR